MKHQTTAALHAYWLSCRSGSRVPAGDLRADDLAPILPSLFLLDMHGAGTASYRFRFCGASIATRYGRDLTDESFLSLWRPEDQEALERDLSPAYGRFHGLVAGVMGETVGDGFTAFEMLLLPLAGERGAAGVIGSMVRIGGHEEMNRIRARILSQWLRSVRFLPDTGPHGLSAAPLAARLATRQPQAAGRRYGHLTVVNGGR